MRTRWPIFPARRSCPISASRSPSRNKAGLAAFDPVTAADRAAERAIRKAIAARYPDHGIVGEEFGTVAGAGRFRWVIDPIDGTRAFIIGLPAVGHADRPAGRRPARPGPDEPAFHGRALLVRRTAARTGAARMARPARIKTRACARLGDAVLTTTHPDLFAHGRGSRPLRRASSRACA